MKRVLLKLSGEALSGGAKMGFDHAVVENVAGQIAEAAGRGLEIGVVIGGGNFWRGRQSQDMDRTKADQIGMLATVMNSIYVSEACRVRGLSTSVFTPFACGGFTQLFSKDEANAAFARGQVVFFAGGTGHPYFSTDTGVVLRAVEVEADLLLLAKSVDGVYDKDPARFADAKRYDTLTIDQVIEQSLQVVDMTASILAKENRMPMWVFGLEGENSIVKALFGEFCGTKVLV